MPWTADEREVFYKSLALLAETLGEALSPGRMAGYVAALDDAPFGAVQIGLREALKTCKFFPKPVELRELGEESREWRKFKEAETERLLAPMRRMPARLSDDETQAHIDKLKLAVMQLAGRKRMR